MSRTWNSVLGIVDFHKLGVNAFELGNSLKLSCRLFANLLGPGEGLFAFDLFHPLIGIIFISGENQKGGNKRAGNC